MGSARQIDYFASEGAYLTADERLQAIVTGLGNVDIRPYIELRDAVRHGDRETALHCQQRINEPARIIAIADGKVVQAIKSATAPAGRATHHMRIAAMDLRPDTVEALSAWADARSSV